MDFFSGLAQGLQPGLDYWAKQGQKDRIAKIIGNASAVDQLNDPSLDPLAQLAAMRASQQPGGAAGAPQAPPPPAPTGGTPLPGFNAPGHGVASRGMGQGGGPPIAPPAIGARAPVSVGQPLQPKPPQAPTGQPGGAMAPTGMGADIADPLKEGQSIIQNLIQKFRADNPKAPMRDIIDAVDNQLDRIKGIAPITKAVMQGQIQLVKYQGDLNFKYTKLNAENDRFAAKLEELAKRHAEQAEFDHAREDHMRRMDFINSAREEDLARGIEYQHEDREASITERGQASERAAGTRLTVEGMKERFSAAQTFDRLTTQNKQKVLAEVGKRMSAQPNLSQEDALKGVLHDWRQLSGGGGGGAPAPKAGGAQPENPRDGKPHRAPDGNMYVFKNGRFHIFVS